MEILRTTHTKTGYEIRILTDAQTGKQIVQQASSFDDWPPELTRNHTQKLIFYADADLVKYNAWVAIAERENQAAEWLYTFPDERDIERVQLAIAMESGEFWEDESSDD